MCRYVGNIHTKVTEGLLAEVFASVGALEGCKLIRKDKVLSLIFVRSMSSRLKYHANWTFVAAPSSQICPIL